MKKRLLSTLLALCMVLTLLPGTVWATEEIGGEPLLFDLTGTQPGDFSVSSKEGLEGKPSNEPTADEVTSDAGIMPLANTLTYGSLSYVINDGSIEITGCDKSATSVDIPAQVEGLPVTSIGISAFEHCENLSNVAIPDSVTIIKIRAFKDCSKLMNITIPGSVTTIEHSVFYDCHNLSSITISNGVTTIGDSVFAGCNSLTSITIPNTVTSIGKDAFYGCRNLTRIVIPGSVTHMDLVFYFKAFGAPDGEGPTTAGPIGGGYDYEFGWKDIIPYGAFSGCIGLTSITIPNTVSNIESFAFAGCESLTSIMIPDGITNIGNYTFNNCKSLTSISIPSGVANVGEHAFDGSGITSITIPDSVTNIGDWAFYDCTRLSDIYYGGGEADWANITIGINNTQLDNATIHYNSTGPDDVNRQTVSGILRSGGDWKINWMCSYSLDASGNPQNGRVEITASESNTKEELYLYNDASAGGFPWELAPYNIPKSAITSLSIRGSISKKLRITASSFTGYNNLRTVALNGVSGIDNNAFYGCSKLEQIALMSPDETLAGIGDGAFKDCASLSKIDFPGALLSIGAEAFRNTALGDITLWNNLEEIGQNAFADCPNLKISCYENSVAHRYAVENNIPFQLIADTGIKAIPIQFHLGGAGQVNMSIDWGWELFDSRSSRYDERLAAMGLALSSAAEDSASEAISLLDTLGFEKMQSRNYGESWSDIWYPGVVFGYQRVYGRHIFAVIIRGTANTEAEDWISDVTAGGFIMSAQNISSQLTEFIQTVCGLSLSELQNNCKFFVTGHSLGGAAANVLAKTLSDSYAEENIFAYTFASPRPIDAATGVLNSGKYKNIHNIVNLEDGVPRLPPTALFTRYGRTMFFHREKTDGFYDNFEILTGREFDKSVSAHNTEVYMSAVLSNQNNGSVRVIRSACPVDIEIYDSAGLLTGRVTDNVVSEIESEKVYICVEGTEKYLYLLVDDDYIIKMVGTGEGTMTYSVQELDMNSGETTDEIVYKNVALIAGKRMSSEPSVADISQVSLYVLGSDDQPELKVLPDGKGTEVPLDAPDAVYTISFDTTVISITVPSMTTKSDGKLSSLPVPVRSDYSFDGWYTTASGGSKITTETIFDRDTTVYAHWTYVGGGATTNPGNPSYYPDSGYWGDYTPPTYAITIRPLANGTITVSPKSALKGSAVTVTAAPDDGYQLASLTVSDSSGRNVAWTDKGNGRYTFIMPGGQVSVSATFQLIPATPVIEVPWSNPFTDVLDTAWYYEAVKYVYEEELMSGYGNNTFAPDATLSRAMLAQILYNKEGRPSVADSFFTDVAEDAWYADAVVWAAQQGIASGYGNGLFGPGDSITREQLAVILWRYSGSPAANSGVLDGFSDAETASAYARDALTWAVESNIVSGTGNGALNPKGPATRAQAAQIFMNCMMSCGAGAYGY